MKLLSTISTRGAKGIFAAIHRGSNGADQRSSGHQAPVEPELQQPPSLRRAGIAAGLIAGFVMACSANIEDPPPADTDLEDGDGTQVSDDPFVLRVEPFTIGAGWYDYELGNIIAREDSWTLVHDLEPCDPEDATAGTCFGGAFLFEIRSYYDDRGTSGLPRYDVRRWEDDAWSEVESLQVTTNIKDGTPVCVSFAEMSEVPCSSGRQDMVLRTEYRAVLPAGFAPKNPAFYISERFEGVHVAVFENTPAERFTLSPEEILELPSYRSLQHDVTRSYIFSNPDMLWAQSTGDQQIALWRRTDATDTSMTFAARCVAGAESRNATYPIDTAPVRQATIEFEAGELLLVELCDADGPKVVARQSRPWDAQWPETNTFDVMIDARHVPPVFLAAPEAPFIGVEDDGTDVIPTPELPLELWTSTP